MAGARVVEEILKRAPDRFDIVMFGAEPYGNYNRILLSNVLNGSQSATDIFMNPLAWYRDNGITLHAGVRATRIDRERRVVVGHAAEERRAGVQQPTRPAREARRSSRNRTTTSSSRPARGRSCRRWRASADPARSSSAPSTIAPHRRLRQGEPARGGHRRRAAGTRGGARAADARRRSHRAGSGAATDDGAARSRIRRHAPRRPSSGMGIKC